MNTFWYMVGPTISLQVLVLVVLSIPSLVVLLQGAIARPRLLLKHTSAFGTTLLVPAIELIWIWSQVFSLTEKADFFLSESLAFFLLIIAFFWTAACTYTFGKVRVYVASLAVLQQLALTLSAVVGVWSTTKYWI